MRDEFRVIRADRKPARETTQYPRLTHSEHAGQEEAMHLLLPKTQLVEQIRIRIHLRVVKRIWGSTIPSGRRRSLAGGIDLLRANDHHLRAAHRVDRYLGLLWEAVQSMPDYRDKTTLIITTDHGRGSGPRKWKDHGKKIKGSEYIWLAVLGPDTPALGERADTELITQSQIAATVAAFLGEDYSAAFPQAGKPVEQLISTSATAIKAGGLK